MPFSLTNCPHYKNGKKHFLFPSLLTQIKLAPSQCKGPCSRWLFKFSSHFGAMVGFEGAGPRWHFLASLVWFQAGCQAIRPTADGYGISQGDPRDARRVPVKCEALLSHKVPCTSCRRALLSQRILQLKCEASF